MKRWLKRGGITVGVLAVLIVAFYAEENWRGARLWAKTKAEYEAKGFNFDPLAHLPRPIPEEQNFAASPIWKYLLGAKDRNGTERYKVPIFEAEKAVKSWQKEQHIYTNWERGELAPALPAELFSVAQCNLDDLYAANDRPDCQFWIPYQRELSVRTEIPHLSPCMRLGLALKHHGVSALSHNDTASALQDLTIALKLARANTVQSPCMLTGLVGVSLYYSAVEIIWQGIETHQWTDDQLIGFQSQLANIHLLQDCVDCLQNELILMALPTIEWVQKHPKFPGAYDLTKWRLFDFYINQVTPSIDVKAHQFYPQKLPTTDHFIYTKKQWIYLYPADILLSLLIGSSDGLIHKFSRAQTMLDLAQVACGLERYWLVNKKYPATLAELEPKFIAKVPHDLCNGEPLHYRVNADGNYSLYSVGFNGVDDGGQIVMQKDRPTAIDYKQGDWVWPRSKK